MVINQLPLEWDPVSLGFDAHSAKEMALFLNPPATAKILAGLVDHLSSNDFQGLDSPQLNGKETLFSGAIDATTRVAEKTAALSELLDRAHIFQKAELVSLAREQYAYILHLHPNNSEASKALHDIDTVEFGSCMKSALTAQKAGEVEAALLQVNRALAINPKESQAVELKMKLSQESELSSRMGDQISKDYRHGVEQYQNEQWDQALASFVRVLNLDPTHKGALDYIQKIGTHMKVAQQ
jgi:tetratricopeptide (TPR) repeat protein